MAYIFRGTNRDVEPEPAVKVINPAKCGSQAGWKRHRKFDESPCRPCKDAINAYHREYRARCKAGTITVREFNPDMCGTTTGYSRHKRYDVPTCRPCLDARAVYKNDYNARRRAA